MSPIRLSTWASIHIFQPQTLPPAAAVANYATDHVRYLTPRHPRSSPCRPSPAGKRFLPTSRRSVDDKSRDVLSHTLSATLKWLTYRHEWPEC